MPELPEVETVVQGIIPETLDNIFTEIKIYRQKIRIPIQEGLDKNCIGSRIVSIKRRSKYILICLENSYVVVIHLGMSGKLIVNKEKQYLLKKHDHVVFEISNGFRLIFNDPRRFGIVTYLKDFELDQHKLFVKLGVEPLTDNFNTKYLLSILEKRSANIKQTIMNANVVVGVGNIYACESLFNAKISPERKACSLTIKEIEILISKIKQVLNLAIKAGGSTLKDYTQSSGEKGYFQHEFAVYGKENQPCNNCDDKILRIRQAGRSTFFCSYCQK